MKKFLILFLSLFCFGLNANCFEAELIEENAIQTRIDEIGAKILNSNKLQKRIVFVYDKNAKKNFLKGTENLTKRQIVIYGEDYKFIEDDNELAGYIAREIASAYRSYDGIFGGWLSSVKMKAAPKKYELVFDKLAVDYMVEANYNPIALITLINKTCPQTRQDTFSHKNLTSKRLAYIYERIYKNYPYYLENNEYIENEHYQNFLLNSQENRNKLEEQIKNKDFKKKVKYE